jgi:hypothetical protein
MNTNKPDLKKLESNLDEALAKETPESLNNFLNKERMNTNEKICKWLKFKSAKVLGDYGIPQPIWKKPDGTIVYNDIIDFLHNRNQQKWIEDKLIELGYEITTEVDQNGAKVTIWKVDDGWEIPESIYDKSKDIALINAVLQLIEKENK